LEINRFCSSSAEFGPSVTTTATKSTTADSHHECSPENRARQGVTISPLIPHLHPTQTVLPTTTTTISNRTAPHPHNHNNHLVEPHHSLTLHDRAPSTKPSPAPSPSAPSSPSSSTSSPTLAGPSWRRTRSRESGRVSECQPFLTPDPIKPCCLLSCVETGFSQN